MTHREGLEGLNERQKSVLSRMDGEWRPASDATSLHVQSPGIVCSTLVDKCHLERRSDPEVWGRSQYRLARATLSEGAGKGEGENA